MNTMAILVKREFWEHRSLWIAPLVWVGIIVLLFAWVLFVEIPHVDNTGRSEVAIHLDESGAAVTEKHEWDGHGGDVKVATRESRKQTVISGGYIGIFSVISAFTVVVVFFYLIDCLFTERRDRSILFWKSMPISDTQVVLSKLAVALLAVPLGVLLLSAATQLVMLVLAWLKFVNTDVARILPDWNFISWMRSLVIEFGVLMGGVLWYAPIAAYFLLLSAWARRLVFLWATVPLLAVMALEGIFFHSGNFARFLGHRFGGFILQLNIDPKIFETGVGNGVDRVPRVEDVYSALDLTGMFTSPEMWLGLAAAAAMVFAAIRLRRYRDDA